MEPRSILIIQTAFIGDVILATALVESLHQKFPQCHIDFMLRKGNEELLAGHPFIRSVLVFDKSEKYKNLAAMISKIRSLRYDYAINVQRFATTGIMTAFSGAKRKIGFSKNPLSFLFSTRVMHEVNGLHEVQRNQRLIEPLTGKSWGRPKLHPTAAQLEKINQYKTGPYITVSPASVWYTKQFKKEKWIEFLSSIPPQLKIILLGSSVDITLCDVISKETPGREFINLAGKLSLLESAALMKDARMNYVNDSAPMHLASAMNAPVTAIFCSTVPSFGFGPLSDHSFIIETPEKLMCRPCGLHGHRNCPEGHFKCALTIQKDQLLATLQGRSEV